MEQNPPVYSKYLSFPSGEKLPCDALVGRVSALAVLPSPDHHCHHPVWTASTFVKSSHLNLELPFYLRILSARRAY